MEDFDVILLVSRCLKSHLKRSLILNIDFCIEVHCFFLFSVSNWRQRSVKV